MLIDFLIVLTTSLVVGTVLTTSYVFVKTFIVNQHIKDDKENDNKRLDG